MSFSLKSSYWMTDGCEATVSIIRLRSAKYGLARAMPLLEAHVTADPSARSPSDRHLWMRGSLRENSGFGDQIYDWPLTVLDHVLLDHHP